jgi:15-cis-phytoene synthase
VNGDTDNPPSAGPGSAVAAAAKLGEPDRYLAATLAPAEKREALLALAAFSAELARVTFAVWREPAMGAIRLQWWRDALSLPKEISAGSEVADAVRGVASSYRLPPALLEVQPDARATQLEAGPLADEAALQDFLWNAEGVQFALAAQVLGAPTRIGTDAACVAAGEAYGMARLLMELPRRLALGRVPLAQTQLSAAGLSSQYLLAGGTPEKIERLFVNCKERIGISLDQARRHIGPLPREAKTAFLPLALVGTYVRAVERTMPEAPRAEAKVASLTRVCRIGLAHWRGRI